MVKKFSRVAAVPKQVIVPQEAAEVIQLPQSKVVNLERIDLSDRENWLRALNICRAETEQPLDILLKEIETYQGQIDQALQTAQAQSTIYAYAIGTRLDVIEADKLFEEEGYANLTAFIKGGEIKRPNGKSITTRQVWAYRRVTRGLGEFLGLAEEIRDRKPLSPDLEAQLSALGVRVNKDVIEAFLESYAESIAGVLELGVSKLEQVYRLPSSVAMSGLLAGKLALQEELVEVRDVPFSALRKAISSHEKKSKPTPESKRKINVNGTIDHLRDSLESLRSEPLNEKQKMRLMRLSEVMTKLAE